MSYIANVMSQIGSSWKQPDNASQGKDYGYGKREDGTNKGLGYFGELKNTSGKYKYSTELAVNISIDGKNMQIPTLVPTLNSEEVNYLLSGGKATNKILNKAKEFAIGRLKAGKSPFAQEGEQSNVFEGQ
jgi:hypothetical protein